MKLIWWLLVPFRCSPLLFFYYYLLFTRLVLFLPSLPTTFGYFYIYFSTKNFFAQLNLSFLFLIDSEWVFNRIYNAERSSSHISKLIVSSCFNKDFKMTHSVTLYINIQISPTLGAIIHFFESVSRKIIILAKLIHIW